LDANVVKLSPLSPIPFGINNDDGIKMAEENLQIFNNGNELMNYLVVSFRL
jgi:hypothetical protein